MNRWKTYFPALVCLAGIFSVSGCGPRAAAGMDVTGKITFDGKPLATGTVTLVSKTGTEGAATAEIKDGAFQFTSDKNLQAGTYLARVQAFVPAAVQSPSAAATGIPTLDQIIPEKYNNRSELTVTLTGEPSQNVTFDLTK